ncbi:MAG TPA: hypothetical protein VEK15_25535 [Vicinamibacteria bacterium]|nr:hypothetical protein [Vicinamibacteria bacterium]
MPFEIDGALYPDREPPVDLESLAERVDFLVRLCSAWDFGRLPDRATVEMVRGADWREAVEETRLLTSCAYHLIRRWHGLRRLPYLGQEVAEIRDDPNLEYV